jgi:putative zinc finger/helix-turn-helix YgiT family protein
MERLFSRKCSKCRERAVALTDVPYSIQIDHDGRKYLVEIPALSVPKCGNCGTIVLDEAANRAIDGAFRKQAGLLSPDEIRLKRQALGLKQQELADALGIAVSTLSRWETGGQIQQRSLDKLLRLYFSSSESRHFLAGPQASAEALLDKGTVAAAPPASEPTSASTVLVRGEDFLTLPLRAQMGVVVRCFRRIQPLLNMRNLSGEARAFLIAVDLALEAATSFVAPPESSVAPGRSDQENQSPRPTTGQSREAINLGYMLQVKRRKKGGLTVTLKALHRGGDTYRLGPNTFSDFDRLVAYAVFSTFEAAQCMTTEQGDPLEDLPELPRTASVASFLNLMGSVERKFAVAWSVLTLVWGIQTMYSPTVVKAFWLSVVHDIQKLARLDRQRFPALGEPLGLSDSGVLGPLWAGGTPEDVRGRQQRLDQVLAELRARRSRPLQSGGRGEAQNGAAPAEPDDPASDAQGSGPEPQCDDPA